MIIVRCEVCFQDCDQVTGLWVLELRAYIGTFGEDRHPHHFCSTEHLAQYVAKRAAEAKAIRR